MNIMIIRIFVLMRHNLPSSNKLNLKVSAIEDELSKHSEQLQIIFNELSRQSNDDEDKTRIGFISNE